MSRRTTTTVSHQGAIVDPFSLARDGGRQIDWANVPESFRRGAVKAVANGAAATGATSITVDPLPEDLPRGAILNGGVGDQVVLTAPAAKGATTIAVEAITGGGIADNQELVYTGRAGKKYIPIHTIMADLSSGKMIPRAARPGAETASGILQSDADEDSRTAAASGYGRYIGGAFYQNRLPDFSNGAFATMKTELEAAGLAFSWHTAIDSRGA